jgi:single-strand DNA-binding protein
MADFNKVVLMGHLTRDAELRFLPNGKPVLEFSLAINRRYKTQEGELKEEVTFVRVDRFGPGAEKLATWLKKGLPLLVEGRLRQSRWEGADGKAKNMMYVVAEAVSFLPRNPGRGAAEAAPDRPSGPPRRAPR